MKLRYYIAFGTCEEVEGEYLGLVYKERNGRRLPFIVIRLSKEVVINNLRLRPGQELNGDVLSVYTKLVRGRETILWSPREHMDVMMFHHKEFLAQNPDYPDLDNLDPGQAARRKVQVTDRFGERVSRTSGRKKVGQGAAAKTSKKGGT